VRFALIEAKKAQFSVAELCSVLKVRRSGFYAWLRPSCFGTAQEDQQLALEVRAVFVEKKRRYAVLACRELRKRGTHVPSSWLG
jgi:hypothetical protein